MLKLSQCMIVKNEEHRLEKALGWAKDIVDEQIVVDTGSTDGTVALASQLGARVLHFDWTHDFSAARNFGISQCSGDWIFFLDADEYFEAADLPLLRPLVEKLNGQHQLQQGKKRRYNVVDTPWVNAANGNITRQARIFRNIPYLRYAGTVHEQLHADKSGYLSVYAVQSKPAIIHTGYVWSEENPMDAKGARNLLAAEAGLVEKPDNAKLLLYAAEALMQQGKYEEAALYFKRSLKNTDGSIPAARLREGYRQWLNLYILMYKAANTSERAPDDAFAAHQAAVHTYPEEPDFDLLLCQLAILSRDTATALSAFNGAMSKLRKSGIDSAKRAQYDALTQSFETLMGLVASGAADPNILSDIFKSMF